MAITGKGSLPVPVDASRILRLTGTIGARAWAMFTSVRFAVLLIIGIVIAGAIGTIVRQFPVVALYDPARYAAELQEMHRRWDGITLGPVAIGPTVVAAFDRLGFFRVFSAWWVVLLLTLLVISIICCTIERLPKLWNQSRLGPVEMHAAFFDPALPGRARVEGIELTLSEVEHALRRGRLGVRTSVSSGQTMHALGERNRRTKLATVLTHLGLIGFLLGGLVTAVLGFDTVLFLGNGQSAPIMPLGAGGNLIVKNLAFEAPRRPNGGFADFRTDLAVFKDGVEIARKVIRVNDPLEAGGYVFHQNTFGPAVDLLVLDPAGKPVWVGPVVLDGFYQGRPQGFREVPGADLGLFLVLTKDETGAALLAVEGLSRPAADGSVMSRFAATIGAGDRVPTAVTDGYDIEFIGTSSWTGLVIKRDPGQPIIWLSFALLLAGLVITFYLPRVRVWARLTGTTLELAVIGDRFVDQRRELERAIAALPPR